MAINKSLVSVGEDDEISIKEGAEMIIDAMDFKGEVVVSLVHKRNSHLKSIGVVAK